ncbi:esterase-like activity of phytase family protein [Novosphingobium mangrovi (ex Huang et al. 2023)]|uniref:Esterase-like activity of phytase family protein n=1 Tax=Novosphingobium mangrovi (ex Huang et al. 2023) TaxID=2976432 RepID=A0ABT2I950_9SPHN|nr:esterase-like activity of phytase family protein [Novosphingobium mangrovi (ex Huang et al. 2023)]MCT2401339.1 esterase-like activity of phytase family protein [Novosphingobium mangrovi (ex Huang et al. 2023)]
MRRNIALVLLFLLLGLTWVRSAKIPREPQLAVQYVPLAVAKGADPAHHLGAFKLDGVWQMASPSRIFGSYSALLPMPDRSLLALSDSGTYLRFMPPDAAARQFEAGNLLKDRSWSKAGRDVESATRDPRTGEIWLGLEGSNSVIHLKPDLDLIRQVRPNTISGWGSNTGPEAMTRLSDGRFVLLREAFAGWFERRRHDAVVFEGDPTTGPRSWHFVFDGPAGFSPTDMAQLPDGRLLILMRRLIWPMPQRFAGRIAIGDPADIRPGKAWKVREVARIASSLPVDNFEGLAVVPAGENRLTVWIISDDNFARLQRTILWKLSVDPRQLP